MSITFVCVPNFFIIKFFWVLLILLLYSWSSYCWDRNPLTKISIQRVRSRDLLHSDTPKILERVEIIRETRILRLDSDPFLQILLYKVRKLKEIISPSHQPKDLSLHTLNVQIKPGTEWGWPTNHHGNGSTTGIIIVPREVTSSGPLERYGRLGTPTTT